MTSTQAHQAEEALISEPCPESRFLREGGILCHTLKVHEKGWCHGPSVTGKEREAP